MVLHDQDGQHDAGGLQTVAHAPSRLDHRYKDLDLYGQLPYST
jgi:hypothetical protein